VIYELLLLRFPPRVLLRLAVILLLLAGLWHTPYAGFPAGAALFECFQATRAMRLPRFYMVIIGAPVFFAGLILGSTPFELNLQNGGIQADIAIALYRVTAPVSSITVMHDLGALCLVAGALLFAPARALLESRLCQFLGKISFMVYLVQIPILCFAAAGIVTALTPRIGYNEASVVAAIGYLCTVLATATLFTRYIDAPAIRASRHASRLSIFRAKTGT
jgi:peptidoglycan/LPS O-acetylase OafA/YrhL